MSATSYDAARPGRCVDVPARSHAPAVLLEPGEVLRVVDVEGEQAVDVMIRAADDEREWLSCVYTTLLNGTTRITTGHRLHSKLGSHLATVVADTAGRHWWGGGFCSAETNLLRYGEDDGSCRENLARSLAAQVPDPSALELDACVSLFMSIETHDGAMAIARSTSRAGDHVDLRAEQRLLVGVSACPQERNPCNGFRPTGARLETYRSS